MKKLFLDDNRYPWDDSWILVRNAKQFKEYILDEGIPDFISFDHDLDLEHYNAKMYSENHNDYNNLYKTFKKATGLDCAKWLCRYCIEKGYRIPQCSVHSMNPIGAVNISSEIMGNNLYYFEEEIRVPLKSYHLGPPEIEL